MDLIQFDNAEDFLAEAGPHLEENEAANGLMLGVAFRLLDNPGAYGSPPFLAAVRREAETMLVALMTPPFPLQILLVHQDGASALPCLADGLRAQEWPVNGVMGNEALGRAFAEHWSSLTNVRHNVALHCRIHALHEVRPPAYSPGAFRRAKDDELDLVVDWFASFHRDAVPHDPFDAESALENMRARVAAGHVFFWDDDAPVSVAQWVRDTPHSAAVGGVYTPHELRGRGYATSCVARLSQHILDSGKDFCTLFTDLANPTSNKIYRSIGYEPVCDHVSIRFQA